MPSSWICTIPGCRRTVRTDKLCGSHLYRLRTHGDTFPNIPIGALASERERERKQHEQRAGFCTCPVSRLGRDNKTCACGSPCVYRMPPAVRDRALAKVPSLRTQIVELLERSHGEDDVPRLQSTHDGVPALPPGAAG